MDLSDDPDIGVWSTDRDCYLLLAEQTSPDDFTLETGSGLSTVLLAAMGAHHTCITPDETEANRILAYCTDHGIDTASLTFEIGFSDEVLPRLPRESLLDLVLVDGNHGYPTPVIDWYYAGSRIRPTGLLVMDDIALPAVAHLCGFIDRDPRWTVYRRTQKWVAYRRVGAGGLRQDWFEQRFYPAPRARTFAGVPGRALRRVRNVAARRS